VIWNIPLKMFMVPMFVVVLLCVIGSAHSGSSRLECLQSPLGLENYSHFQRGNIWDSSSVPLPSDGQMWQYINQDCPLKPLNPVDFCTKALGCGKNLLLIGDSTVLRWQHLLESLFVGELKLTKCVEDGGCKLHRTHWTGNSKAHRGCVRGGHLESVRLKTICGSSCAPGRPSHIRYVRHDYISGRHGSMWFGSTLCDDWTKFAVTADYILVSIGPHIHNLLSFPNGKPAPQDFDKMAFMKMQANISAHALLKVLKPNAKVIYRSGSPGVMNFTKDCNAKPLDRFEGVYDLYSWPLIIPMQDIYIEALQDTLGKDRVLIVDTRYLMPQFVGCRKDYVHLSTQNMNSPVLTDLQVLYNVMLEHSSSYATMY